MFDILFFITGAIGLVNGDSTIRKKPPIPSYRAFIAGTVPAIILYVARNLTTLYQSLSRYSVNLSLLPSPLAFRLEFAKLVFGFLIPTMIAFITSLIFPVATNKQNAILFALPVSILHFYYFSLLEILRGISLTKYPGDAQGVGYQEIIHGIEYASVSLLLLATVALINWSASKIRLKI